MLVTLPALAQKHDFPKGMYCGGNVMIDQGRIKASSLEIDVVDQLESAVPKARIQVEKLGEKTLLIDKHADENGRFHLDGLPPGEYWLGSSLYGFNLHIWHFKVVRSGEPKRLQIKLTVGT